MDDSPYAECIQKFNKNDVDAKISGVTKLQELIEAGTEVVDPEPLIQGLKTCLKTQNLHLQTATLPVIPSFLSFILSHVQHRPMPAAGAGSSTPASTSSAGSSSADIPLLRHVLATFLASPGLIERLSDAKEKNRDKARESVVLLGGFAFRAGASSLAKSSSGKAQETPMQIFERYLRESGLQSKVWRVREQSILTLVHIRRTHHLFPLRPYLPLLVESLEDSDSTVREVSRSSVVELFTGPGVSDAARSDLKKELAKKGIRKQIADDVIMKVLAGGSRNATTPPVGSDMDADNVDAPPKKAYIPPSLALRSSGGNTGAASERSTAPSAMRSVSQGGGIPRPPSRAAVASPPETPVGEGNSDVSPVYIASSKDLENEIAKHFGSAFEGKETEHNWASRDKAIARVRGMLKGEVHIHFRETFLVHLKQVVEASIKTLLSLRTIVATATCAMYSELAIALGPALDPVCEILLRNLLKMAGFTKKIAAQTSQASVVTVLTHTSANPRVVIPLLAETLKEKTAQGRQYAAEHISVYIATHGDRSKHLIEAHGMDKLEEALRKALSDATPGVRANARNAFWAFTAVWPDRAQVILAAQDPTIRKQIEKSCPNPELLGAVPAAAAAPVAKKSVAQQIAATRAKARVINNDPPSLRHQATSMARTISPPQKRAISPSTSAKNVFAERPASPVSRASTVSPTPPRPRVVSNGSGTLSKSTSARTIPSHSRSLSSESGHSTSSNQRHVPPSITTTHPSASPPRGSVLKRAMLTALPSSPPATVLTPPTPQPRQTFDISPPPQPALHIPRDSAMMDFSTEPSLLTAVAIPLPEDDSDSDMDMDDSNLISFSSPYEKYPPASGTTTHPPVPLSPQSPTRSRNGSASFSPRSSGSKIALSTPPASVGQPLVEDAMRARAEQAESAAERLLELVEPDETIHQDTQHPGPFSSSLLLSSNTSTTPKAQHQQRQPSSTYRASGAVAAKPLTTTMRAPVTPQSKSSWKQSAVFQDSPAYERGKGAPSLMGELKAAARGRNDSAWWRKRMTLFSQRRATRSSDPFKELQGYIAELEQGTADAAMLQKLALFCSAHPATDLISPLSSGLSFPSPLSTLGSNGSLSKTSKDIWSENKNFDRLLNALERFLVPEKSEDLLEYGLIVLWEMLEHQPLHAEGREGDIFAVLLRVRYSNKQSVMEATNTIRDSFTMRIEPVYGLTTMHATLLAFRADAPPPTTLSPAETKAATYAYGLIALGKFILRLPAEILEDELPRMKGTLISALNDTSSLVVRESAAAVLISAQLVIRDETHLFALLDGLADEKKNLLTYLFDKHGARGQDNAGTSPGNGMVGLGMGMGSGSSSGSLASAGGVDRLEREMRRLDGRTSTPPRVGS